MADIPHDIETFLISSIRVIEIFSSQNKNYIRIFITAPVLTIIDNCIDILTFQIFLQCNCIIVVTPEKFCLAFRSRTLDHPYLATVCYTFYLCWHLCPAFSPHKFLLNILFQIFLHFLHIFLLKFDEFLLLFQLFFDIFFLVFKFFIYICASCRNDFT